MQKLFTARYVLEMFKRTNDDTRAYRFLVPVTQTHAQTGHGESRPDGERGAGKGGRREGGLRTRRGGPSLGIYKAKPCSSLFLIIFLASGSDGPGLRAAVPSDSERNPLVSGFSSRPTNDKAHGADSWTLWQLKCQSAKAQGARSASRPCCTG